MFIHWGISSVRAVGDLSWGMIRNTPFDEELNNSNKLTPEEYWKQADEFDPQNYDPDLWMKAAREAGFRYAVLTTRHHDGYALWPSKFGNLSTRTHIGGRDLVRPYVEACRNHDIKVGFFYSPGDWLQGAAPARLSGCGTSRSSCLNWLQTRRDTKTMRLPTSPVR